MTRNRIPGTIIASGITTGPTIIATLTLGLTTTVTGMGTTERRRIPVEKNLRRGREMINENDENKENFVERYAGNSDCCFGARAEWLPGLPRLWSPPASFQQVAAGIGETTPSTRGEEIRISFFASLNSGSSRPDAGPTEPQRRKDYNMMSAGETNQPALEETSSLFQPDCLLPVQYFENFCRKVQTEPEKRLMLAVLDNALACFQKYFLSRGGRGLRLFRETEEWIFREKSGRAFSFVNICEIVGFDPQYIRQGLLRWRERRIAELAKIDFQTAPQPKKARLKPPASARRRAEAGSGMMGLGV